MRRPCVAIRGLRHFDPGWQLLRWLRSADHASRVSGFPQSGSPMRCYRWRFPTGAKGAVSGAVCCGLLILSRASRRSRCGSPTEGRKGLRWLSVPLGRVGRGGVFPNLLRPRPGSSTVKCRCGRGCLPTQLPSIAGAGLSKSPEHFPRCICEGSKQEPL
jgi:hypothetical protein